MRDDHDILLDIPTDHRSHSSGKALRGLLGRLTAQHKGSWVMKKRCHGEFKLLRAKLGGIASIMLVQSVYHLNTGVQPRGHELRSFVCFGLRA